MLHHPTSSPTRSPRRARRPGALRTAALLVTGALVLGGCGVRLETPPPSEPSPDVTEQVRARTVDDALHLAAAATAVAEATPEGPVRAALQDVAASADLHVEQLGGVYDSGLPRPGTSASPSPTPPGVTDVTGVLGELVDDATTAALDADVVPDGGLARLVASVAVARDTAADRLAAAAGLERPEPTVEEEPAPTGDGPTAGSTDDGTTAPPTPGSSATPAPDGTDAASPAAGPEGAAALALAHDEAAWTFAVLAARSTDERRATLLESAAAHRRASDAWAARAGVVGRRTDPRRAAYALPAAVDDPAVVEALPRELELAVADASANTVAGSPAGARDDAIASLRAATAAATRWGAAPVPFPGMPELGAVAVG